MDQYALISKVPVIIPVYNEEENIPALLEKTGVACESLGPDRGILFKK